MTRLLPGGILLLLSLLTLSAFAEWRGGRSAAARSGPNSSSFAGFTGPPGLVLDPDGVDLRTLSPGTSRDVAVRWRRTGSGTLRVLAVKTGCGCAAAEGLAGTLSEGARGTLLVRLSPRSEPGPVHLTVRVFTDAPPPFDLVALRIAGYVGWESAVRPALLDVGLVSPGAAVKARFSVHLPLDSPRGDVTARLRDLQGEVRIEPSTFAEQTGPDLVVTLRSPATPGPFSGVLEVRSASGLFREVPLRGHVVFAAAPAPPKEGGDGPR